VRGMAVDFDWRTGSAPAYVEAYKRAAELRRAGSTIAGAAARTASLLKSLSKG